MPYTQADFDSDLAKLRELSAGEKPSDLCAYMQWYALPSLVLLSATRRLNVM